MLALESQVEEKDLKLNNLEIINEMNKDQAILPKVVLTQIIHYLTKDVSIFTQANVGWLVVWQFEYSQANCGFLLG